MPNQTSNPRPNSYPFGSSLKTRAFSAGSGFRFGFNGKESEHELGGEEYDLGEREFYTCLGKMISIDPKSKEYPWQSSYSYFYSSPIFQIDYNGAGDYYDKKGNHLGTDGKKDDLAYTASGKRQVETMKNGKGTGNFETLYENIVKLPLNNSTLNQYANTVAKESSGDNKESFAIASAIFNLAKNNYHGNIYNTLSAKNQIFGFRDGGNSKEYKSNAEFSMGAVINALTGGYDYSNGAIRWDGFDLAARGFEHPKAKNQGVYLLEKHIQAFKAAWPDELINKFSGGKYNSFSKNFKVNPGCNSVFQVATHLHVGMVLYSSSAVYGKTLFWKANKHFYVTYSDRSVDLNLKFKGQF